MQLTKDDVKRRPMQNTESKEYKTIECIDLSKFQQVVDFYYEFRENQEERMEQRPDLFDKWQERKNKRIHFIDWLFNYCFVDGLKDV